MTIPSVIKHGGGKYCSVKCRQNALWSNPEYRKHMSDAHKGIPMSADNVKAMKTRLTGNKHCVGRAPWNKGLIGFRAGADNNNWKGGITPENHKQRVVFRQKVQTLVFQRDDYTCLICEQYGGSLQVDHIKSWKDYPELRFDMSNCRTLCMACHYYVTFKKKMPPGITWGHNLKWRIES